MQQLQCGLTPARSCTQGQAEVARMQKTVTGLGSQMRVLVASVRRPSDMAALAAQAPPLPF